MIIRHKAELVGSSRAVATDKWSTTRFLLREDGVGLTLTDITLHRAPPTVYGYRHHVEVGYCLAGHAWLEDLGNGTTHDIGPGTLWAAAKGERFRFEVVESVRLITIFVPALVGPEVNDTDGSFPLLD